MSEDGETYQRTFETDAEDPAPLIAETVADIEEKDMTDLSTMHDCIDGILDNLFSNPPSPESELQIQFKYEGYHITIEQDGQATFTKIE